MTEQQSRCAQEPFSALLGVFVSPFDVLRGVQLVPRHKERPPARPDGYVHFLAQQYAAGGEQATEEQGEQG